MKGVMKFGKRVKLSPRYIGLFEIFWTVGDVDYELALPLDLSVVLQFFMFLCFIFIFQKSPMSFIGSQFS